MGNTLWLLLLLLLGWWRLQLVLPWAGASSRLMWAAVAGMSRTWSRMP
jgi:hypothetical protein